MTSAESFLPHFRNCDRRVSAVRPEADEARKAAVTQAAQAVLDARARYAESTLADLYDPLTMPPELSKAHAKLDALVAKPIDATLVNLGACSGQALRPSPPTPTASRISSRSTLPP